jgi:hypothetical protein
MPALITSNDVFQEIYQQGYKQGFQDGSKENQKSTAVLNMMNDELSTHRSTTLDIDNEDIHIATNINRLAIPCASKTVFETKSSVVFNIYSMCSETPSKGYISTTEQANLTNPSPADLTRLRRNLENYPELTFQTKQQLQDNTASFYTLPQDSNNRLE